MQYKKPEYCAMIEEYINSYRNRQGSAPSVREIAAGVGLAVSTVSKYLSYMRQNGPVKPNRSPAERVRFGKEKQGRRSMWCRLRHHMTSLPCFDVVKVIKDLQ